MANLSRVLTVTAERDPRRRAAGGREPMRYGQWDARTNRLARALILLGVRPGDRVVLMMACGVPMAGLHLALQKIGATSVPVSPRLGAAGIAACLRDSAPRLLVTDGPASGEAGGGLEEFPPGRPGWAHAGPDGDTPRGAVPLDRIAAGQPDGALATRVSDQDESVILYTAGTTGRPKGVVRTHAAEHAATVAHLLQSRHGFGETTLGAVPLYRDVGLRALLASVLTGGTWVPQPEFDAGESLELVTRERVSTLYLEPPAYRALLGTGRLSEVASVRTLGSTGSVLAPELARELADALQPEVFFDHLGSTEISTHTVEPDVLTKRGGVGRAGIFSRVRLITPEPFAGPGDLVPDGEPGQLAVSMESPEAFAGYLNRPDAHAEAVGDGWYLTGDLAVRDEAGDLRYLGRMETSAGGSRHVTARPQRPAALPEPRADER
ncbi:class I adenylate-forming enzyme family protein [Bailinhaonella thermotolerans]|uniref:Long-chain fatty acid--CoA ligase n=1 Tax=Bailinhaonella thermotolerans TaxID=1070861 RepID=A0A3A4ACG5_9ACTN|nr:long-chain fatty acid--CoA ligase [Bailinhaonella thermotolerans]RJL23243.1 long-chain fatty acid--CoA ligase [Bailinhaonella thermotolerans]